MNGKFSLLTKFKTCILGVYISNEKYWRYSIRRGKDQSERLNETQSAGESIFGGNGQILFQVCSRKDFWDEEVLDKVDRKMQDTNQDYMKVVPKPTKTFWYELLLHKFQH